jgi:hypothetical protein
MPINNEKKVSVTFRYHKIHKSSFFENYLESFDNLSVDAEKSEYKIETAVKVEPLQKIIFIEINASLFTKSKIPQELLGIKTTHEFLIENFTEAIKTENDQCILPDDFIVSLLSISYSSVRGMLFESVTEPNYKRILLPLINPKEIYENMKEAFNNNAINGKK